MPQMAPLMWNNLFLLSMILSILSLMKMFFSINKKNSNKIFISSNHAYKSKWMW